MKSLVFILFSLLPLVAFNQQELYVDIECSNDYPGVNEQVKLTYTLRIKSKGGVTSFRSNGIQVQPPSFSGFQKIDEAAYNPGFSFGNMNADMAIMAYDVILKPTKKGDQSINPVSFIVNNQVHKSEKFTLHVGAEVKVPGGNADADMFVTTELNKTDVYVGEPVAVSFKIYLKRGDITETDEIVFPQFSGFWQEEYPEEQNWQERNINGVNYRIIEVRRNVIFPQRPGEFEIEPFKFTAKVRVIEGSGWNRQYKNYKWTDSSAPVKLNVKPLPAGQPEKFIGTFSNLQLSANATPQELDANQAITLTTKFTGAGNLKMLEDVKFDFPKEFEVYDPKVNNSLKVGRSSVSGSKSSEYVILVRKPGDYVLEPQQFSYFDYSQRKYKTLSIPEFSFQVNKGNGTATGNFAFDGKNDVNILNQDVRFIKTNVDCLKPKMNRFFGSVSFYAVCALPMIAFIGLFFFVKKRDDMESDPEFYRMKKAAKMARKHLKKAEELSSLNDQNAFYEELSRALYGYLGDKYGIQTVEMNYDKISERLEESLSEEIRSQLVKILSDCDMARYAPSSDVSIKDALQKAQSLIEAIEKS